MLLSIIIIRYYLGFKVFSLIDFVLQFLNLYMYLFLGVKETILDLVMEPMIMYVNQSQLVD